MESKKLKKLFLNSDQFHKFVEDYGWSYEGFVKERFVSLSVNDFQLTIEIDCEFDSDYHFKLLRSVIDFLEVNDEKIGSTFCLSPLIVYC